MEIMPTLYNGRCSGHRLDIIIVGGGIVGLATAFALQNAGHRTTVLDRNPKGTIETGGGQHIAPNGVKILSEWGLEDELLEFAFIPEGVDVRHYDTEELIGHNPYHPQLVQDSGAPFLMTAHDDIHSLLQRLAIASGATIQHNKQVVDVDFATNSVRISDGSITSGDLIVAADGAFSPTRRKLFPDVYINNDDIPMHCLSTVLPASRLDEDEELKPLLEQKFITVWAGPQRVAWGFPVKNRTAFALNVHYPSPSKSKEAWEDDSVNDWKPQTITDDVREGFSKFGRQFSKLFSMIESAPTSKRIDIQPLEILHFPYSDCTYHNHVEQNSISDLETSSKTAVVLVGHAAHPILPTSICGMAMAIEDAAVLGSLLSRYDPAIPSTSLPALLSAYTAIRHNRSAECMLSESSKTASLMLDPTSPAAQKRNEWISGAASREMFPAGDFIDVLSTLWSYHAGDDAEEWWSLWKLPGERSEAAREENEENLRTGGREKRLNSVSIGVAIDTITEHN